MGLIFCFVIQTRETLTLFTQTQHKPKGINPNPTFANNFTNPPLLWDRLVLDRPLHAGKQIRGKSLRVLFILNPFTVDKIKTKHPDFLDLDGGL